MSSDHCQALIYVVKQYMGEGGGRGSSKGQIKEELVRKDR